LFAHAEVVAVGPVLGDFAVAHAEPVGLGDGEPSILWRERRFDPTARWLRNAFSDLAWEVHDVVHEGDLVVVHATMSGRGSETSPRTW